MILALMSVLLSERHIFRTIDEPAGALDAEAVEEEEADDFELCADDPDEAA